MSDKNTEKSNVKETPLSVMAGSGDFFKAQGKKYKVKPLKLKEVDELKNDEMFVFEGQFFNMSNPDNRKKLNKWIEKKATDESGEPLTLEKAMNDDWDLNDLKEFMRKLLDLSG